MEHAGAIANRELIFDDPSFWRSDVAEMDGRRVVVTLAVDRRKRSTKQNAYLFGVCYHYIAESLGYDVDDIHELMKAKFLQPRRLRVGEEDVEIPASTRKLNTAEFSAYTENIRRWAAEFLSISIPTPNEESQ